MKIKIELTFFTLSGIGTLRVKMVSQRSKVEIAPPTGKICDIQHGRADSEIRYAMFIASAKIPECK